MTDAPNVPPKVSTRDIANVATKRSDDQPPPAPAHSGPALHGHAKAEDAVRDALFPPPEAEALRTRWEAIQTGFVDEPRTAVTEADALVAQTVTRLAEIFSGERTALEKQWGQSDNISTEDLRVALRRYRSFFDRLLSV